MSSILEDFPRAEILLTRPKSAELHQLSCTQEQRGGPSGTMNNALRALAFGGTLKKKRYVVCQTQLEAP